MVSQRMLRNGALMKRLAILVLLIPVIAWAEPQPWMKKSNPRELGIGISMVPHCPFSPEDFTGAIVVALINGQMEYASVNEETEVYVSILLNCNPEIIDERAIFSVDIEFVGQGEIGDVPVTYRYGRGDYAIVSIGNKLDVYGAITEGLEMALLDYRVVNEILSPIDKARLRERRGD
jgi:hypothetical protein